jgi:hypothetical protein
MSGRPWPLATLAILLLASSTRAQTLADLARHEEERRKAISKPAKVYTNDDLRRFGGPTTVTTDVKPVTATAAPPTADPGASGRADAAQPADRKDAQGGSTAPATKPAEAPSAPKDEAYWKSRISDARLQLDRDKGYAEAMQSRINGLTTDFVARDDPAQRAVIAANRDKALSELGRLTKEIADLTKKVADIQEEARRAGVPAGWVR